MVHPYDDVPFCNKKEGTADSCHSRDGPRQVMPSERSQTPNTSYRLTPFIGNVRKGPMIDTEGRARSPGLGLVPGRAVNGVRGLSPLMDRPSNWMVVMVAQHGTFSKNHRVVCVKSLNFLVCKLYFNQCVIFLEKSWKAVTTEARGSGTVWSCKDHYAFESRTWGGAGGRQASWSSGCESGLSWGRLGDPGG